jgi:hypothetical protein
VVVGEDVARVVDDEAGAEALRLVRQTSLRSEEALERAEELVEGIALPGPPCPGAPGPKPGPPPPPGFTSWVLEMLTTDGDTCSASPAKSGSVTPGAPLPPLLSAGFSVPNRLMASLREKRS